jgi:hypothetical protein
MKKRLFPFLGRLLAVVSIFALVGCESPDNGRRKKKVVTAEQFDASGGGVSGQPWNRPRSFESGAGMGRMMPQSR